MADQHECRIDVDGTKKSQEKSRQADEKATSNGPEGMAWVINKHKLLEELKKVEESNTNGARVGDRDYKPGSTKIQNVPESMWQKKEFKKYFKPKKFAIGPIHAYNHALRGNIVLKFKLAGRFIAGSGKMPLDLFGDVRTNITDLKGKFDERVIGRFDKLRRETRIDDPMINEPEIDRLCQQMLDENGEELNDSLSTLLFLDGCAVLQFIHSYVNNSSELKELKINSDDAIWIQLDLFLLENQIPYQLLKILMKQLGSDKQKEYIKAIYTLLHNNNIVAFPIGSSDWKPMIADEFDSFLARLTSETDQSLPIHLLDLLRSIMIGKNKHDSVSAGDVEGDIENSDDEAKEYRLKGGNKDILKMLEKVYRDNKRSFRNVQELKSAGIQLKPSLSPYMRSVSFKSTCFHIRGHLQMPSLIVDNWTKRKLLNLVAYERCLGVHKRDYVVTSYLKLMDLLIDSEDDVKELRKAHIVRHHLSSDKDVADLFNTLGSKCLLLPQQDVYRKITRKVDKHCHRQCAIWAAKFYYENCSSPWTFMTFLLAIITGLITIRQFWSTIFPEEGASLNAIANL